MNYSPALGQVLGFINTVTFYSFFVKDGAINIMHSATTFHVSGVLIPELTADTKLKTSEVKQIALSRDTRSISSRNFIQGWF